MIPRTARPSRRSVAGVAATGLVSACSAGRGSAPAGRRAAAAPPGTVQRTRAAGDGLALLARYDAALAAHPALGTLLLPLRAEVAQHVAAFGGRAPKPSGRDSAPGPAGDGPATRRNAASAPPDVTAPGSSSGASPAHAGGTPPPTPSAGSGTPAPPTPAAALTALAAAERDLAARRTADLAAVPGDLARLLASVAACAAGHVVLLTAGVKHI